MTLSTDDFNERKSDGIMIKTNAMRLLEAAGIFYETEEYSFDEEHLSGEHILSQIEIPGDQVFKTLVAHGDRTGITVFCIPVLAELDLKKAASVSKNKKVELIHVKDLLGYTGYIRGGCSPIGMKKKYRTFIDETAILFDKVAISGGQRGVQIIIDPESLMQYTDATAVDLLKE